MKCPKCNADNAYQPLMRQIECENSACDLFVCPPGKITPAQSCGEFVRRVRLQEPGKPDKNGDIWPNDFPAYDGTKPFFPEETIKAFSRVKIQDFKVGDKIRLKKEYVGTVGFQASYFKDTHIVNKVRGKEFISNTLAAKDRNGKHWPTDCFREQEYYEKVRVIKQKGLTFPNKPIEPYKECEMVVLRREIADRLFLTRHDYVENKYDGFHQVTFTIQGYFNNAEDAKEAEKLVKSILNKKKV